MSATVAVMRRSVVTGKVIRRRVADVIVTPKQFRYTRQQEFNWFGITVAMTTEFKTCISKLINAKSIATIQTPTRITIVYGNRVSDYESIKQSVKNAGLVASDIQFDLSSVYAIAGPTFDSLCILVTSPKLAYIKEELHAAFLPHKDVRQTVPLHITICKFKRGGLRDNSLYINKLH